MDPRGTSALGKRACWPRLRGDGPFLNGSCVAVVWLVPPARGWTREGSDIRSEEEVSPACAGMHRSPRPPVCLQRDCPARAGMGRWMSRSFPARQSWPRPCGDGPHSKTACAPALRRPRPCGDGPYDDVTLQTAEERWPRLCGDEPTPRSALPTARLRWPRPSGDGPLSKTACVAAAPWPRPCGDDPGAQWMAPAFVGLAPPARSPRPLRTRESCGCATRRRRRPLLAKASRQPAGTAREPEPAMAACGREGGGICFNPP